MITSHGTRTLLVLVAAVAIAHVLPVHAEDAGQMATMDPKTLKFTAIPDLPSCATGAIIRGNPRNGPAWVMLRLASGCQVPMHWHTANEDLVVISGQGMFAMEGGQRLQFSPGAYASLPSHHLHRASCSRTCLLFSIADAAYDIHYVDANGNEISAKRALQQPSKRTGKSK